MSHEAILEKTRYGAAIVNTQVRSDIASFSIPVKIERDVWRTWMGEQFDKMGMTAMARDVLCGIKPATHARVIAFETLYELGGYSCPHLCHPAFLQGDDELTYWRAIAIAKNAVD